MSYTISDIEKALTRSGYDEFEVLTVLSNLPKKRSSLQNAALHKLFEHISNELKELGITYRWKGLRGKEFETPYTGVIVKEFIWRPIQKTMFDKTSTTKLTTGEINEIFSVLSKFFAEKGICIEFPSNTADYANYLKRKR